MATKPIANLQRMAKDIQMWPVEKLIPWARNPRTHSDAQVAQIATSIAEFGFNNPILVDTEAGIIAGHGRLLGARKLGPERSSGDRAGSFERGAEARVYHRRQ
jgi:hypothetical protein